MHFQYPLVLVVWEDIFSDGAVQGTKEEVLRSIKPCLRYTPGWLLDDTGDYVILATDYDMKEEVACLGGPQQFPKAVVRQVLSLSVKRARST